MMQAITQIGHAIRASLLFLSGLGPAWAFAGESQNGGAKGIAPPQPMTDILDIKPPVPVGGDGILFYVAAAIGAILVLLAFFYWQRRRRGGVHPIAVPRISPHEAALRAMEELAMMPPSQGKVFYFRLGEVLRAYLRQRFRIDAPEMTTEELTPKLGSLPIAESDTQSLAALFRSGDLVKFADVPAKTTQMKTDLSAAEAFVTTTAAQPGSAETALHNGTTVPVGSAS